MAADIGPAPIMGVPWHGLRVAVPDGYHVITNLEALVLASAVLDYHAPRKPKVPRVPNKRKRGMHKRVDCDW